MTDAGRSENETMVDADDNIPELKNLTASIFMPLTEDLLAPRRPPRDREERLKCMLASIDQYEKSVRDNMVWMFEREGRRIAAAAQKVERDAGGDKELRPPVTDAEAEQLVRNMEASAKQFDPSRLPTVLDPHFQNAAISVRQRSVRDIMKLADDGAAQMQLYSETHVGPLRDKYKGFLDNEAAKKKARFGNGA